jgi:hypothetical protein
MAEFLIYIRESDNMHEKGDIEVVRPDGFNWSDSEKPNVIKRPDIKFEDAQVYEQSLTKQVASKDDPKIMETQMVKSRKYKLPPTCFAGSKLNTLSTASVDITKLPMKTVSAEIG